MVQNSNNTQLESTLVEMEQITLRPLTQESADAFMQYLNSHVSIKDDPRTSELIETFERQLQQIQASWAQEKLRAINEVRLARTELAGSVQVEVTQSHPLVSSESLQAIGISITEALRVAELAVGTPVTAERIKNYQSDQGISIDQINVRIGKETYCEMRAGELRNDLKNNFDDINWLKDNMESAILVLQNGNRAGKNMVELAVLLEDYKSHHEEKPEFERMYGDFYRNEMNARRDYAESEAGQETQRRAQEQAAPLWDTLTDPNIPVNDKIEAAISNPTLLLTAGILFLFGVVGANTSATDSVFKRIGWILGGMILGPQLWREIGGPALESAGNMVRSPEAQTMFDNGKTAFLNFFRTTLPDFFRSAGETLGTQFESFVQNFESANEAKRNSPDYIENISEKGSVIISDPTFLNASQEQIIEAQANGSLAGIISDVGLQKINELHMSTAEIQNYLRLYVLPRFTDEDNLVRDIFMISGALAAAQEVQLDLNKSYIANPDLNLIIQTDINNLRLVGTEAQINAATQLAIAVQGTQIANFSGTFGNFRIENHPALSPQEKLAFETLLKKLQVIFTQEGYISQQITSIGEITLSNQETEFTLTTRLESLEGMKQSFAVNTQEIQGVGLTPERFSIQSFETSYSAKRMEILRALSQLTPPVISVVVAGVTINIAAELQTEADRELQAQNLTDTQNILDGLGEVPASDASINDMRSYYDTHAESFRALDTLNASTLSTEMRALVDQGVAKKAEFISNYTLARQRYVDAFQALQDEVAAIVANGDYREARTALQNISGRYYTRSSEILKNMIAEETYQDLSYYFTGAIPEYLEENSVTYLDDALLAGTPVTALGMDSVEIGIKDKIQEIESAFDTQVDLTGAAVGNRTEIHRVIQELSAKKEIISLFVHTEIQSNAYRALAEQFKTLQNLYIAAIQNETDVTKLNGIISEYRESVQSYVIENDTGFWNDAWAIVEGIFGGQDAVETTFEEKKSALEIESSLQKDILDPSITELKDLCSSFLLDNHTIPQIEEFRVKMEAAINQGQIVTLFDIYSRMIIWSTDPNFPENLKDELIGIITTIENTSIN